MGASRADAEKGPPPDAVEFKTDGPKVSVTPDIETQIREVSARIREAQSAAVNTIDTLRAIERAAAEFEDIPKEMKDQDPRVIALGKALDVALEAANDCKDDCAAQ